MDTKFQEPKCSQHSYSSPSDQIPFFSVEGALYYERDTKFQEPKI